MKLSKCKTCKQRIRTQRTSGKTTSPHRGATFINWCRLDDRPCRLVMPEKCSYEKRGAE